MGYTSLSLMLFVFLLGDGYDISILNSYSDYVVFITHIINLIFILYMSPLLYKRFRALRLPQVLKR